MSHPSLSSNPRGQYRQPPRRLTAEETLEVHKDGESPIFFQLQFDEPIIMCMITMATEMYDEGMQQLTINYAFKPFRTSDFENVTFCKHSHPNCESHPRGHFMNVANVKEEVGLLQFRVRTVDADLWTVYLLHVVFSPGSCMP